MVRLATLSFDGEMDRTRRHEVARGLGSAGAEVTSWGAARSLPRTYAALRLKDDANLEALAQEFGARAVDAPLVVVEITPRDPSRLPALAEALGGSGRPAGVVAAARSESSLVVELDDAITPLRLILDVVDVELNGAPGRRIEPLLPLRDETLAAFAGATLAVGDLDAGRLIETYAEPLLNGTG